MPARTGQQYIDGLRAQEREIWLGGERVKDVTRHTGLSGGVKAIASLYDMQHDPKLKKEMTYKSPSSGDKVGRSFANPKTREELETRTQMMLNWARTTNGMMGRSPDFMNVTFAAWGAAALPVGVGAAMVIGQPLIQSNARVEPRVEEVDNEVGQDRDGHDQHDQRLGQRVILVLHR